MRIMIVDNDASLLRSLGIVLRRRGHDVRCFADPAAMLDALAGGGVADAVLVDLLMPRMTGLEVLAAGAALLPRNCRKAIITGHAESLTADEVAASGVQALFPKPLDLASITTFLETEETRT